MRAYSKWDLTIALCNKHKTSIDIRLKFHLNMGKDVTLLTKMAVDRQVEKVVSFLETKQIMIPIHFYQYCRPYGCYCQYCVNVTNVNPEIPLSLPVLLPHNKFL